MSICGGVVYEIESAASISDPQNTLEGDLSIDTAKKQLVLLSAKSGLFDVVIKVSLANYP